mgnify:CR=1 FL=1|jgi:hypothetical protein
MALNFNHGTIQYRDRMSQVKDFGNLHLNGYTPTDIDFIYDVAGEVFVIGELKSKGARLPMGQLRMLTGLMRGLMEAGKEVVVLVGEHDTEPTEDIDVGNVLVTDSWHSNAGAIVTMGYIGQTIKQASEGFLNDKT